MKEANFFNSELIHIGFHTVNLGGAVFDTCNLYESSFIEGYPKKQRLKETTFINCSFIGAEMPLPMTFQW